MYDKSIENQVSKSLLLRVTTRKNNHLESIHQRNISRAEAYLNGDLDFKEMRSLLIEENVFPLDCGNWLLEDACQKNQYHLVKFLLESQKWNDFAKWGIKKGIEHANLCGYMDIVNLLKTAQLTEACGNGQLQIVKLLLEDDVFQNPKLGRSRSLEVACLGGYTDIVKLLLKKIRVFSGDSGRIALFNACRKGHIEIVKLLLKDQQFEFVSQEGSLLGFKIACLTGNLEVVTGILKKKILNSMFLENMNAIKLENLNAIKKGIDHKLFLEAYRGGRVDIIGSLMNPYLSKSFLEYFPTTPLEHTYLRKKEHKSLCNNLSRLITHNSPIELACKEGYIELVKLFIEDKRFGKPEAGLGVACSKGHTEIVKLFLNTKDLLPEDRTGDRVASNIPWLDILQKGHIEVAKLLLDDEKCSPLFRRNLFILAYENNYMDFVKLLLAKDKVDHIIIEADFIEAKFTEACKEGSIARVKFLLSNTPFKVGYHGLIEACSNNRIELMKYLLKEDAIQILEEFTYRQTLINTYKTYKIGLLKVLLTDKRFCNIKIIKEEKIYGISLDDDMKVDPKILGEKLVQFYLKEAAADSKKLAGIIKAFAEEGYINAVRFLQTQYGRKDASPNSIKTFFGNFERVGGKINGIIHSNDYAKFRLFTQYKAMKDTHKSTPLPKDIYNCILKLLTDFILMTTVIPSIDAEDHRVDENHFCMKLS